MCRLSHSQISESYIHHELQFLADMINFRKEVQGVFDVHSQYFGNVFPSSFDCQDFRFISFAIAQFARDIGIRQKLQFYLFVSVSVTGRTCSFIRIEAEIARVESKIFAIRRSRIQLPDMIKGADKGSRAGSRRFADARLIYVDGIPDLFIADDGFHGQVLVKFLHRQILVMLIFVFVHNRCSKDVLPIPSFFQKFQSDEALDEFLLFIQKLE